MPGNFPGIQAPAVIQPNRMGHLEIWRGTRPAGRPDLYIQQSADVAAMLDKLPAVERAEIEAGFAIITRSLPSEYFQ